MSETDTLFSIPSDEGKQETDAERLCRALEIKRAQERAAWARSRAQFQVVRAVSILFLFIAILGICAAFYFASERVQERRTNSATTPGAPPE